MNRPCLQGVVAVIPRGDQLLFIRRAEGIRAAGWWCLPGGAIEPGESPEQAVVREIEEELGAVIRPRRKLWEWVRPDGHLLLHWWLVDAPDPLLVVPNPAEVAETRWVTPAQARDLSPVLESNVLFLEHYERTCRGT
jgi:mutator protein MutT